MVFYWSREICYWYVVQFWLRNSGVEYQLVLGAAAMAASGNIAAKMPYALLCELVLNAAFKLSKTATLSTCSLNAYVVC